MAAKRNPFIEAFQQRLADSGLTVAITGVWDAQTRKAMNTFQADNGLATTIYPNAEVMALSGITPSAWAPIAMAARAPSEWVSAVSAMASKQIAAQVAAQVQEAFKETIGRDTARSSYPAPMVPAGAAPSTGPAPRTTDRPTGTAQTPTTPRPTAERPQGVGPTATEPAAAGITAVKHGMPTWGWVAVSVGAVVVVGIGVFLAMRSRGHGEAVHGA